MVGCATARQPTLSACASTRTDPVLRTIRKTEYAELVALFFLQGAALGMWFVPLSTVLDAHGLHAIKPFAFAASALAAMVSPYPSRVAIWC